MDANHPDHVCEVCLHAAPLDNGITAGSILFASPILVEAPLPAYQNSGFTLVERLFDARGPPVPRSA